MKLSRACPILLLVALNLLAPQYARAEDEPPDETLVISGHAMFRYTQKIDADNSAELYNLRLYLDRKLEGLRFFAEPRFRQTPLRAFSPSNVWLQQAWVGYEVPDALVSVYAGLRYTKLGLFWDNSWFGNLPYLNGLKLDPDYGLEVSGVPELAGTDDVTLNLEYAAQYFPVEDGLNGFFAPESKLDALGALPAGGRPIDFDSSPGFAERHIVIGRLVPSLELGPVVMSAGASLQTAELEGVAVEDVFDAAPEGRKTVFGAQASVAAYGASIYAERLAEEVTGIGADITRTYYLAGAAYTYEREATWLEGFQLRANASYVDYETAGADEWFVAPGVFVQLHEMLGLTAEYVRWEFEEATVVNRIEWIIHAYF
jgi:hypothetical protein